jgi:GntR family transcriptional regulator/MocR family aminotransferase
MAPTVHRVVTELRRNRHLMAATDHAIAWTQLFGALDRAGLALHLQIRRAIVAAIERRVLTPEARLPSSRQLASLLGVARNTVVAAYQQLIDEGFLIARERSGIFLAPTTGTGEGNPARAASALDWSGRLAIRPSLLPQITKPRDWLDYPYPFVLETHGREERQADSMNWPRAERSIPREE